MLLNFKWMFIFTFAVLAICNADRLDRTYLPPVGADTAGGSDGALSAPSGTPGAGHHGLSASRPQSPAFRQQPQSSRPHSPSFESNSQPNAFNGSPNSNSNFGRPNENDRHKTNVPNARYPSNDRIGPSQESANNERPNTVDNSFDASNPNYPSGNRNPNVNYQAKNQRPQASQEANAAIIRSDSNTDGDGFSYSYETENGISADESGIATNGVQAQGSYSYTGDDGQIYSITYTADENGYRPVGDHLPTPPPIPDAILRSIEDNARAAAANPGANDDEYDNSNGYQNGNGSPIDSQGKQPAHTFPGEKGPLVQGTPAKYQQNEPNTQGYNGGRPSSNSNNQYNAPTGGRPSSNNNNQYNAPTGGRPSSNNKNQYNAPTGGRPSSNNNNQYNAPTESGPASPSGYPGSRPQTHPIQSALQGSRRGNLQGSPDFGGKITPSDSFNGAAPQLGGRPSNQGAPNGAAPQLDGRPSNQGAPNGAAPQSGGRPSNQGSTNEQFGPRRPPASFSSGSGYKY